MVVNSGCGIRLSNWSEICECGTADRSDSNDEQRWRAPNREEDKAKKRDAEITRHFYRCKPQRIVERRAQQADNRGIEAAHDGLRAVAFAKVIPERQGTRQYQHPWEEYPAEA